MIKNMSYVRITNEDEVLLYVALTSGMLILYRFGGWVIEGREGVEGGIHLLGSFGINSMTRADLANDYHLHYHSHL